MQRFMGVNKNAAKLNDSIKTGERSIWNSKHHNKHNVQRSGGDAFHGGKGSNLSPFIDSSF